MSRFFIKQLEPTSQGIHSLLSTLCVSGTCLGLLGSSGNVKHELSSNVHNLAGDTVFMGRKLKFQLCVVCLRGSIDSKYYGGSEEIATASRWCGRENVMEKVKLKV